jgi:hypothetical protein
LREKTASASESLANNLAANAADGEEALHGSTMGPSAYGVKALFAAVLPGKLAPARRAAIVVNY